jgi:hypothetical protein
MPHWRHMMSSDKLYAADLMGREHTVEIDRVVQGEYPDMEDPKKKLLKPDVWFVGKKKPLGLNSTNARAISALLGTPVTEEWAGRFITLYPTTTRAFGETHECIRVKNRLPKEDKGGPSRPMRTNRDTAPTKDGKPLEGIQHPWPADPPIDDEEARLIAEAERKANK